MGSSRELLKQLRGPVAFIIGLAAIPGLPVMLLRLGLTDSEMIVLSSTILMLPLVILIATKGRVTEHRQRPFRACRSIPVALGVLFVLASAAALVRPPKADENSYVGSWGWVVLLYTGLFFLSIALAQVPRSPSATKRERGRGRRSRPDRPPIDA